MMGRRDLLGALVSLLFLSSCGASTAPQNAFVVRRPFTSAIQLKKSLETRGGALLEKRRVAQVATVVSLAQGALAWLDPLKALDGYGIQASPVAKLIMRLLGAALIQMGVIGLCLFFTNCSLETTLGSASLGLVAEVVRSLKSKEHETIGFSLGPQLVILIQSLFVSDVNLSNRKVAATVNKINATLVSIIALSFALAPKWVLDTCWGMHIDDEKLIGMVSGFGYWCIAYAIYIACLAWNLEAFRALTWNRLFILLIHVIPSRGESIGMNKSKQMILLAYQALILVGLVLQDCVSCLVRCSV
jgi:hypothetical protein